VSYTVYEIRDSESGSIDQSGLEAAEVWAIQKRYVIGQCPGGFYEAASAIADYAPRYVRNPFGRMWRRKKLGIKGLGKQVFDITADYETLQPISGEDAKDDSNSDSNFVPGSIAWDTTGGTEHRTQAVEQRVRGQAVDVGGAINVSNGNVQGVDVIVPSMKYSETWIMPLKVGLSYEYVGNVFELTGKVNKAKFRAFDPGEALFLGARCQWSGDQPYVPITFDFHCRPNVAEYKYKYVDPSAAFVIETIDKKGWEHVSVIYQNANNADTLVRYPRTYVFDTIYEDGDFSLLNIVNAPGRERAGVAAQSAATAAGVAAFFAR